MSIELVIPSKHLILCRPLLLLPSVSPSSGSFPMSWLFTSGGQSIEASNEYSGLISFRIDWFDLLDVQGTLKSLLHHHSSNSSILWHSAFFMIQLSQRYMTTGKTIALTRWTLVGKVISLLFDMLSRLKVLLWFSSVQFSRSVVSDSLRHDCSMSGSSVRYFPEFAQIHVHWFGDAI